ncbi:hypothetical protein [Chamaesiphon sp. VAR_69_metabat_338]|nr:hypothetical protein [Chamaesiphon sp. VAR_69_metabat_338]
MTVDRFDRWTRTGSRLAICSHYCCPSLAEIVSELEVGNAEQ